MAKEYVPDPNADVEYEATTVRPLSPRESLERLMMLEARIRELEKALELVCGCEETSDAGKIACAAHEYLAKAKRSCAHGRRPENPCPHCLGLAHGQNPLFSKEARQGLVGSPADKTQEEHLAPRMKCRELNLEPETEESGEGDSK